MNKCSVRLLFRQRTVTVRDFRLKETSGRKFPHRLRVQNSATFRSSRNDGSGFHASSLHLIPIEQWRGIASILFTGPSTRDKTFFTAGHRERRRSYTAECNMHICAFGRRQRRFNVHARFSARALIFASLRPPYFHINVIHDKMTRRVSPGFHAGRRALGALASDIAFDARILGDCRAPLISTYRAPRAIDLPTPESLLH
jgi:hypothetical protein